MAKSNKKSWSAFIYILAIMLIGSLSSTAWTQNQPQKPAADEMRKQLLDRLSRQLQDGRPNAKPGQPPAQPATQQPQIQQQGIPASSAIPMGVNSMKNDGVPYELRYENAELYDVIKDVAGILGLTPLIVDPDVKGSVVINSGTIKKDDILPLFNIILKNNGAALVKHGGVYQVIPIPAALKKGLDIIEETPVEKKGSDQNAKSDARTPASSSIKTSASVSPNIAQIPPKSALSGGNEEIKGTRYTTHVIRVDYVPVKDLIEPIKTFMTDGGFIMPYERLNMIILTDYTDSAARIMDIIHMLDSNWLDPDLVELVKVENNASSDVVDDLKRIYGGGSKDAATGTNFVALDRMNAIFITAGSKSALEKAKGWIKKLDSASGRSIQTNIYVVENSTASNIAMMLSALYGGEDNGSNTNNNSANDPFGALTRAAQGLQNQNSGGMGTNGNSQFSRQSNQNQRNQINSSFGGTNGTNGSNGIGNGSFAGSSYGSGRQLGLQLNNNRTIASQVLKGGAFTGLQDTVRLVADDVNNSLVVQATAADYAYLSETIKKMDVLPRQVIIDARIFEVDLTNSLEFGVGATLQGKTDGSTSSTTVGLSSDGALAATTTAFVRDSQQVLLALKALSTRTKVRVLEAPSVLALDGTQAHIVVGSEIPYPSASYYQSTGGTTTSVEYRDTGISLVVLPRISASGHVTLDVANEVSAPGAEVPVGDNGRAVSFSKTSVNTTLSVKDGETVAIAGLIRDSNNISRGGIPFLSDIPLLGSLFGYNKRSGTRSELIILITPHVIRTTESLQEKSQALKDSLRNVRKYADEKDKELLDDREEARKDRYNDELKNSKKTKSIESKESKPKKSKKSKKEKQKEEKEEQGEQEEKQDAPQPAVTPVVSEPPTPQSPAANKPL